MHAIGVSEVISVPDRIPVIFALRRYELQSFQGTELLKRTASSSTRGSFFRRNTCACTDLQNSQHVRRFSSRNAI